MKHRILFYPLVALLSLQPLFAQATFSATTNFTTGTTPQSLSIGDLNGDGKPDMAVANSEATSVSVFLNTTSPGAAVPSYSAKTDFTTGSYPISVSVGDLNGDGLPDMAVANYLSGTVSVFLNTTSPGAATPTFSSTDFTAGNVFDPISVSLGDLNGDGNLDIAVANNDSNTVSVFLNTTTPGAATPTFAAKTDFTTGTGPYSVSTGDFNGDGMPDMAVVNLTSKKVSVFLNTTNPGAATPTFSAKADFTTGIVPYSVSIGDLNGDGKPDMAVANQNSNTVSVFLNTMSPGAATPTFSAKTDFTTTSGPRPVLIGDLNGDGKPDLAVANNGSNTVSVFLNTTTPGAATPTFAAKTDFTTGTNPASIAIGDLNGDGKPDLAVAIQSSATVSVLLNTTTIGVAAPVFSAKTDFTTGNSPYYVAHGDLNGDGMPDMAVANLVSSSISVFLNTTSPGASAPAFSTKTDFLTGASPFSVCIGEFNGDGKPDMVSANYNANNVTVFLSTTTPGATAPTFSAGTGFTTGANPYSVSVGDFNGDGKEDLAVTNSSSQSTVSVFLNTTTPGGVTPAFSAKTDFVTSTSGGPRSVSIGDLNGDGKPDMAVANSDGSSISVFFNTTTPGAPAPTFFRSISAFASGSYPISISIADFNGDGKQDLVVTKREINIVTVYLNATAPGDTTFAVLSVTDFASEIQPYAVSVGDLNGDGKPDLAVAHGGSAVYLNTTSPGATVPTFSPKTEFANTGGFVAISIEDFNGDGKPDLAGAGGAIVSVLLNEAVLPLPVEMISFSASAKVNTVELVWNTATEVNNYGFDIERKPFPNPPLIGEGIKGWGRVGFVEGAGTTNSPKTYSYVDRNLTAGKYAYRLKQIDRDGQFTYSQEVEFTVGSVPSEFKLLQNYPNPFNPSTTIQFTIPATGQATLKIFNVLGQEVAMLFNGVAEAGRYNQVQFQAAGLASGLYFSRLEHNGKVQLKKMLLVK